MQRRQRDSGSPKRAFDSSQLDSSSAKSRTTVHDSNTKTGKKHQRIINLRVLCWVCSIFNVVLATVFLNGLRIMTSSPINQQESSGYGLPLSSPFGKTTTVKPQSRTEWEAQAKRKILARVQGENNTSGNDEQLKKPSSAAPKKTGYRVILMNRAASHKKTKKKKVTPASQSVKRIGKDYSLAMNNSLVCSLWSEILDDFWHDHPDWEPSERYTNGTHTCFEPIQNEARAAFFKRVAEIQFVSDPQTNRHCDPQVTSRRRGLAVVPIEQAGFAASLLFKQRNAFWSAFRQHRTFQQALPHRTFVWHYVPPYNASTANTTTSWPACPTNDMDCYFLPLTNCPRHVGPESNVTWTAYKLDPRLVWRDDMKTDPLLQNQLVWLSLFLMRPRQETRRRLYQLSKEEAPMDADKLKATNCTWVHVRRADAMTEGKNYPRNFYPISEYLDRGNISPGETVYLLTDDTSAIEEATVLHPEYHWIYWNRTRYRGPQNRNQHFPSHDKGLETLRLLAETKLAGQCRKGVHGNSNVVRMMVLAMTVEHGADNIETIEIDKRIKNKRIDAADFMKELETKLAAAREREKTRSMLQKAGRPNRYKK